LNVNGTSISVPLTERSNGRACYSVSFDPGKYFSGEGVVSGELVLTDNSGNSAARQLVFFVNLEAPRIEDVKVEKVGLGKYNVSATVKDENLKHVVLVSDGRQVPLNGEDGKFHTTVEALKDLDFAILAVDKFNMTSTYRGRIEFSRDNPNVAYALQKARACMRATPVMYFCDASAGVHL